MNPLRFCALALALGLAACGAAQDEPAASAAPAKDQGRAETAGIRNTEHIGYAGKAIADEVDTVLDASDARTQELDRALESQERAP